MSEDTTHQQLVDNVQGIVDQISGRDESWVREYQENHNIECEHCSELSEHELHQGDDLPEGDEVDDSSEDKHEYSGELTPGAYEWLEDVLDIEYTVSQSFDYLGARLCVAFGGPSIFVDTRNNVVEGYWWGDRFTASFSDSIDLDDACEEMFSMNKG